jgi:hypothetical protein
MTHIKEILAKTLKNASKAKFYYHNRDIFLRYFDSWQQYEALIAEENFEEIQEIIKSKNDVGNIQLTITKE